MLSRYHQKLASWVALLVILFAALAPAVSHAFATKSTPLTLWQEICTAQGTKFVSSVVTLSSEQSASTQDDQSMQPHVGAFEHCPFCTNPLVNVDAVPSHSFMLKRLDKVAKAVAVQHVSVHTNPYELTPPAQAPPSSL